MQKIALLYDASQAVLSSFDMEEVLQQILQIMDIYFHLESVAILLMDKETNELYPRCHNRQDRVQQIARVSIGTGIAGTAAAQRRPLYVPDILKDARFVGLTPNTRSQLAVPLMVRDEVVGVLDCQSERVD